MPTISELASDVVSRLTSIADGSSSILQQLAAARQDIATLKSEVKTLQQAVLGVSSLQLTTWMEPQCYFYGDEPYGPEIELLRVWVLCRSNNGLPISSPVTFDVQFFARGDAFHKLRFNVSEETVAGSPIYKIDIDNIDLDHPNALLNWHQNATYAFLIKGTAGGVTSYAIASTVVTRSDPPPV